MAKQMMNGKPLAVSWLNGFLVYSDKNVTSGYIKKAGDAPLNIGRLLLFYLLFVLRLF